MGEVWKARDTRLNRIVAIKRLSREHAGGFEREARAIAALNHPHICQIFDIGADYLVLEFVAGSPLQGPLAARDALQLAVQVASALEAAHECGILHRDLKPGNILVTKGGVKLLDFGLAKLCANVAPDLTATVAGTVMGTPAFMSPEQALGKCIDARSDVFSFGAVLYELLSGKRAFRGETTLDVLTAVVKDEPSPLNSPAWPVVKRCLDKDPTLRFQSAAELRQVLEAALAQVTAGPVQAGPSSTQPSIAVLPFANMCGDKENEYFSDGLAEEIINALTHVTGLKVIARTSSFAFKGQNEDVRRIAAALGVITILEGSVRRVANRIRVTAQLISASDGSHLWSERFDRELADVFAIQDEIAAAVAKALEMKLIAAPRAHVPNLQAYEELLKARHHVQKWSPESSTKARECFERAIELDPQLAIARCELCWCLFVLVTENQLSPQEGAAMMRARVKEALEIDPSIAEAHACLGIAAVLDYDWNAAGKWFRLSEAYNPVQPSMRCLYSQWYLAAVGRMKDAIEQIELALKDDPLNLYFQAVAGWYRLAGDRPAEGVASLQQVLELDPNYWLPYLWLGAHHLVHGRVDEAFESVKRAYLLASWNVVVAGLFAGLLERTGDREQAYKLVESFGDGTAFGAPVGLFCYYMSLTNIDCAATWFENAIEQRDTRTPWIVPHLFGSLFTSNPRWPELARKMNLT